MELNEWRIEFFKNWSRDSAWVYGLILGDGSVPDGRVMFTGNLDTVNKFTKILKVEREPKFARGAWHTHFDSVDVVRWFRSRGVESKKSHSLPWPEDLPAEFKWDFIRGLIDTDGGFNFDNPSSRGNKGRVKFCLGYTCASESFMKRLLIELGEYRKPSFSIKKIGEKKYKTFNVRLGMERSIEICAKVYDCATDVRNEERYNKYLHGLALWQEYQKPCSIDGCEKIVHSQGLCTEHMWKMKKVSRPVSRCIKCEKVAELKGMCVAHYHQNRREKLKPSGDIQYHDGV